MCKTENINNWKIFCFAYLDACLLNTEEKQDRKVSEHDTYITNEGAAYGATRYRNSEQAWHLEPVGPNFSRIWHILLKNCDFFNFISPHQIKPGVWMGIGVIPIRHLTQNG